MPGPQGGSQVPKGGLSTPKTASDPPQAQFWGPRGPPGPILDTRTPWGGGLGVDTLGCFWGPESHGCHPGHPVPIPLGAPRTHLGPIWGHPGPLGATPLPPTPGSLGGHPWVPPRASPGCVCKRPVPSWDLAPLSPPPPRCHPGTGGGGGDRAPPPVPIFLYFESNLCFFCCFFLTSINIYRSCRLRPHAGGWAGLKGEGEGLKWGGA